MKSTLLSGVLAAVVVFVIPLFWIELATRGGRPTPCVPIDGRLLLTGIWLVWGVPVSLTAGLLGAGVGPVVLEAALEVGVEPTEGNLMVLADLGALPLESAGATRQGRAVDGLLERHGPATLRAVGPERFGQLAVRRGAWLDAVERSLQDGAVDPSEAVVLLAALDDLPEIRRPPAGLSRVRARLQEVAGSPRGAPP
jgi:hypothetical protein